MKRDQKIIVDNLKKMYFFLKPRNEVTECNRFIFINLC